jgi:ADP-heptose:LPS heptosyltransferase
MSASRPPPPLLIRLGAFGDMVMTIPAMRALARRYGQPCDVVSAGPWTPPLIARVPEAGRLLTLEHRSAPYYFSRSQRALVRWLRSQPPRPVYLCEHHAKLHRLLSRGGVGRNWLCAVTDLPVVQGEHWAERALRLAEQTPPALQAIQAPLPPAPPSLLTQTRLQLDVADEADCDAWLARRGLAGSPLVLLQPGNKKTMRRGLRRRAGNIKWWPEERWAEVIQGVEQSLPAARIVLCGSPAERLLAGDILRLAGSSRVFDATAELPIPRLLALQARAHSMISVDTGPAHSAAAMGCPLVAMFAQWHARLLSVPISTGAPVVTLGPSSAADGEGLLPISAPAVISAWRQMAAV